MKKSVALLLIIVMSTLCACSSGVGVSQPEQPETQEPESFEGYSCTLTQKLYFADKPGDFMFYKEGTALNDLAVKRVRDIESERNCKLNLEYTDSGTSLADRLQGALATGQKDSDIVLTLAINEQYNLVYGDCLVPLPELRDYIDYTDAEKYGPANMLEVSMKNGMPYMVTGYSLPENQALSLLPLCVFNPTLMSSNNLTDVRELYENGSWTWQGFEAYLRDYTLKDGETSVTALSAIAWAHLIFGSVWSNGVEFAVEDSGKYVSGINSPQTVAAIEWVQRLKSEYSDCIRIISDWMKLDTRLANNETMLIMTEVDMLFTDIAYMVDDFGIAPFPCGTGGVYGKTHCGASMKGYGITAVSEESDISAQILSLLLDPYPEYPGTESLRDYYMQVFHDARDINVYFELGENSKHFYVDEGAYSFFESAEKVLSKKSASEIIAAFEGDFEGVVDEYIAPNYSGMAQYFG